MKKITIKDYIDTVRNSKGNTVILFGSRCGRCIKAKSTVKKLPSDINTFYCDIEREFELSYLLGILYVPTVIVYRDGHYIGRVIGDITTERVKDLLWQKEV